MIYKLFEKQLSNTEPVTEEILKKFKIPIYFSGEAIKAGDVVLFAMLHGNIVEKEGECPNLPINFVKLNEKHFHLFESDKRYENNDIPTIKLKKQ